MEGPLRRGAEFAVDLGELLLFPVAGDVGFHHPDGDQILLYGGVDPVQRFLHPAIQGAQLAQNQEQAHPQQRDGRHEHEGEGRACLLYTSSRTSMPS